MCMQALQLNRSPPPWVHYLKEVNLFSDLHENPTALDQLACLMEERRFKIQDAIIRESEASTEMFILISGEASVYKSTTEGELYKVAILKSTHPIFFGEGALLDAEARSATIRADAECHCLVLSREKFNLFIKRDPAWALPIIQRIARSLLSRLRKTNDDLSLLYHALVEEIRGK